MICDTCNQPITESAVKVYHGRKVCPSCFETLVATDVPESQRTVQVVRTQTIATTVCPDCNAEVHKDTRKCPHCGGMIRRLDRAVESAKAMSQEFAENLKNFLLGCIIAAVVIVVGVIIYSMLKGY